MSASKVRRASVKERKIEDYLRAEVEAHGGLYDKFVSPGRRGVPDCIITWQRYGWAQIDFVECKTIGGKLDPLQEEDHKRRRAKGCIVHIIWSVKGVDDYILLHADSYDGEFIRG